MAGVLPKQAVTMTKDKMDRFMKAMGLDIREEEASLNSECMKEGPCMHSASLLSRD